MGLRRQFLHCMVRSPLWPVRGPNCTGQALCVPTTAVHSCKVRDYYHHAEASASANWPPSSILLWDRKPTSQDRLAKRWMWCSLLWCLCESVVTYWHACRVVLWSSFAHIPTTCCTILKAWLWENCGQGQRVVDKATLVSFTCKGQTQNFQSTFNIKSWNRQLTCPPSIS